MMAGKAGAGGMGDWRLFEGDALDVLPTLAAGSVDAVICDLPYGTTNCKWDAVIPFAPMWAELRRVTKPGGAIVLFGMQPFTSALIMSNPREFRYTWVWDKRMCVGHANARIRPLMAHEDIMTFGRGKLVYNPQMVARDAAALRRLPHRTKPSANGSEHYPGLVLHNINRHDHKMKHPSTVIRIPAVVGTSREKVAHPVQKPVALMAYLIRTYSDPGAVILDFAMGSGSTGVAAIEEGRDFIGIEKDTEHGYFEIARRRLVTAQPGLPLGAA